MKPYMLIEGSNNAIAEFEKKVAEALEMGYSLAGELVMHPISATEAKFYQSVCMLEDEDEEDYEEDYEEEEMAEED